MFGFLKHLTPKLSKTVLIERIGKQRYVNLVAYLLSSTSPGEEGSYERFKAVVAAVESELRAAKASPLPFVQSYILRVRNDQIFQQVLGDISEEYYDEKYKGKSFVDFFIDVEGFSLGLTKTEEERNLHIECRGLIVEKVFKIEKDIFRLGTVNTEEYKQVEQDIRANIQTSEYLQKLAGWVTTRRSS